MQATATNPALDWIKRQRWTQVLQLLGAAIVATVVGDLAFQVLTGEYRDWSWAERAWRGVLIVLAYGGAVLLGPAISRMFSRVRGKERLELSGERAITPTAALIVIASSPNNPSEGPARTSVNNFIAGKSGVLQYLFIIHSDDRKCLDSVEKLQTFAAQNRITVRTTGLLAKYDDPRDMYEISRKAIDLAIGEVRVPEQVTFDITGGSKMASVGAAMAIVEREDEMVLGYIPNVPGSGGRMAPGTVMKAIDISWMPRGGSPREDVHGNHQPLR